jgi:hypothetical protein
MQSEIDMHNEFLLLEPTLQKIDGPHKAIIIAHKHDKDENLIGSCILKPMVNTWVYIAELEEDSSKEYKAYVMVKAT